MQTIHWARRVALFVIFGALSAGCYLFQSSHTYYGLDTAGQKVVFVLDVSGSMEGKNEGSLQGQAVGMAVNAGGQAISNSIGGALGRFVGGQAASEATKLGGAKRELIPAIQGLPDTSSFSLVTFGNEVKPWMLGMVQATSDKRNIAAALIKDLEASGGTPAQQALQTAFNYNDVNIIFFVSDGRPTDGSPDSILSQIASLNRRRNVVIHTVGLGDDQDEAFLTALATQNRGSYVRK